jgi:hypothetical protein
MVLHQIGPVVSVLALFLVFFIPKKNIKNYLLWFLFGVIYVTFTVIRNKDFRFTLPLLPIVAVWISWGVYSSISKIHLLGIFVLFLILGWLGFNFVENSFGWPIKKPFIVSTKSLLFEDIDWVGFDDYPVRQMVTDEWPTEKIVGNLSKNIVNRDGGNVLVLVNIEELNDNNLTLYKTALGENEIYFGSVGATIQFESEDQIKTLIDEFDYFLVPEDGYEATPFYSINLISYNQARDWIWGNIDNFEILKEYQLPNQKKLYLLEKL